MDNRISQRYLGQAGVEYAGEHHGTGKELGYRLNAAFFLPYLRAGDTLLDFGCGNGGMVRVLKEHVARADALEVNPAARAVARQDSGCTVYGDLKEIPRQPIYDAIISNHVLEHVRDVCGTLEALRERLKPGGRLVVMLPIDDF
jgi:2-polyprenyl-3-methyl-5-hydroxy-6-metoxy-1,4-benzoquinol methylase